MSIALYQEGETVNTYKKQTAVKKMHYVNLSKFHIVSIYVFLLHNSKFNYTYTGDFDGPTKLRSSGKIKRIPS